MQRSIVLLCVMLPAPRTLRRQGVTTASMSGIVTTDQGEPLPGANVVAVHEPTGTRFGTSTRINGQFDIPNMKIGGPYTLTVTHIGYKSDSKKDLYLSLAHLRGSRAGPARSRRGPGCRSRRRRAGRAGPPGRCRSAWGRS